MFVGRGRGRLLANLTAAVSLGAAGLCAQALVSAPAATSVTFNYTGGEQTYAVPSGVTEVTVTAVGGTGGGYYFGNSAKVTATVPLPAGTTTLYVEVGGQGSQANPALSVFNGGGAVRTGLAAAPPMCAPPRSRMFPTPR